MLNSLYLLGTQLSNSAEMVVFVVDDLGSLGPGPRDRALYAPRHCLDA